MYKVNDYIVYGLTGVCQISDIGRDEYASSDETQYYTLNPVYNQNITIKVPVKNEISSMRPVLTKNAVLSLIATMPDRETLWLDDDRQRNADFKAALKSGKSEEWAKIIKTLYLQKEARAAIGKKLAKPDEEIMRVAEKHLNQEFAIALNIQPDEVRPYILEHVTDHQ